MLEEENTMQEDEKLVFEDEYKEIPVPVHDLIGDVENIKADLLKLITVVDGLEQRIVNVDAKYKMKLKTVNSELAEKSTVSIRDINKEIAKEMKEEYRKTKEMKKEQK